MREKRKLCVCVCDSCFTLADLRRSWALQVWRVDSSSSAASCVCAPVCVRLCVCVCARARACVPVMIFKLLTGNDNICMYDIRVQGEVISRDKYVTGDACRRDEDGYYWITGRVDDVINVAGHRIGTAEVPIHVYVRTSYA